MLAYSSLKKRLQPSPSLFLLFCLVVLDAVSTVWLIACGIAVEHNWAMDWVIGKIGLSGMAVAKIVYTLLAILVGLWFGALTKRLARIMLVGYISIYIFSLFLLEVFHAV